MGIFGRNPFIGRASGVGSGDAAKAAAVRSIYAPGLSGPGAQTPKYGYAQGAGVNLQPFMGQIGADGRYGAVDLTPGQDGTWGINGQGKMGWGDLVGGLGGVYGGQGGFEQSLRQRGMLSPQQQDQIQIGVPDASMPPSSFKYGPSWSGRPDGPPGTFGGGIGGGPRPDMGFPTASGGGIYPDFGATGGTTGTGPSPYAGMPDGGTPLGDVGGDKNYADQFQNFYQG